MCTEIQAFIAAKLTRLLTFLTTEIPLLFKNNSFVDYRELKNHCFRYIDWLMRTLECPDEDTITENEQKFYLLLLRSKKELLRDWFYQKNLQEKYLTNTRNSPAAILASLPTEIFTLPIQNTTMLTRNNTNRPLAELRIILVKRLKISDEILILVYSNTVSLYFSNIETMSTVYYIYNRYRYLYEPIYNNTDRISIPREQIIKDRRWAENIIKIYERMEYALSVSSDANDKRELKHNLDRQKLLYEFAFQILERIKNIDEIFEWKHLFRRNNIRENQTNTPSRGLVPAA